MKKANLLAALLSLTFAASADDSNSLRGELKALEFLVGWCWTGQFPDGKRTDTHCFESVYEGMHVRDRHVATGGSSPYRGESIYSWNNQTEEISFVYWNSIGGVSTGTAKPKGSSIFFPDESYEGPDGQVVKISSAWENITDDDFDAIVTEAIVGGATKESRIHFRRRAFLEEL